MNSANNLNELGSALNRHKSKQIKNELSNADKNSFIHVINVISINQVSALGLALF